MTAHGKAGATLASSRATGRLALWTLAWLASVVLAALGPEFLWDAERQPTLSWAAVILSLLVGTGWIIAYRRFLQALDDLQRKIMLDALAITLGVGWVVGIGFFLAYTADLVHVDLNIAVVVMALVMSIAYVGASIAGRLRYR